MNKVWETVLDVFIGIIIIFISVTIYFGIRTETVMKSMYESITNDFITDVKRSGVIYVGDYEKFIERMEIGHNIFDIQFEHRYKILEPEYRFKTLEEILEELKKKYSGSNDYLYREVITEKPHVDDPINDGNLNTETNESILAKAKDTHADPNHVHDENCYIGHKHSGEPYFIHTHQHTPDCLPYESTRWMRFICNQCNKEGISFFAAWYWNSETKSVELSHVMTPFCGNCGSYSIASTSIISEWSYTCGYKIDIDGDGFTDTVGYDNAYQYIKSYPEERIVKTKITYISGCYQYHERGYLPLSEEYIVYATTGLLTHGFDGFCTIPERLQVTYYWQNSEDDLIITFRPFKDEDGTVKLNSYFGQKRSMFTYTLPTVDFKTFKKLCSNSEEMYTFLKDNYSGNIYINPNGILSSVFGAINMYGSLDICDEPIHDTWHPICGLEEDATIGCNHIIVSLVPTHPNQTVYINDPLITTAVATYKDGSTKTVVCTTDFLTSNIGKDQEATLTYNYTIQGKNYSKSCDIQVTVIPRSTTCSKGHTYNLNPDGTDPGCPYCKAWVESLRVIHPNTSPIVITIGTTLQENGIKLLATYMDGRTEEVTSGYIDNLDKNYLGTKPVTIGYKGASVTVLVTTVCATMVCDICGYEYELYPDGTNPGCPRCLQKIPVFTGNIMEYEHINHTEEILESMYSKGKYMLNDNDVFSVSVKNRTSNRARLILKKVYPSLSDRWFILNKSEHIKGK